MRIGLRMLQPATVGSLRRKLKTGSLTSGASASASSGAMRAGSWAPSGRTRPGRTWRRMLRECHPCGEGRAPGVCVTYLLDCERHGIVCGLSFVAAGWHCVARDAEIGWSERARVARNDCFRLMPWLRLPCLASRLLACIRRQLPRDWCRRYGIRHIRLERLQPPPVSLAYNCFIINHLYENHVQLMGQ